MIEGEIPFSGILILRAIPEVDWSRPEPGEVSSKQFALGFDSIE
jgi:hypothetical protein